MSDPKIELVKIDYTTIGARTIDPQDKITLSVDGKQETVTLDKFIHDTKYASLGSEVGRLRAFIWEAARQEAAKTPCEFSFSNQDMKCIQSHFESSLKYFKSTGLFEGYRVMLNEHEIRINLIRGTNETAKFLKGLDDKFLDENILGLLPHFPSEHNNIKQFLDDHPCWTPHMLREFSDAINPRVNNLDPVHVYLPTEKTVEYLEPFFNIAECAYEQSEEARKRHFDERTEIGEALILSGLTYEQSTAQKYRQEWPSPIGELNDITAEANDWLDRHPGWTINDLVGFNKAVWHSDSVCRDRAHIYYKWAFDFPSEDAVAVIKPVVPREK